MTLPEWKCPECGHVAKGARIVVKPSDIKSWTFKFKDTTLDDDGPELDYDTTVRGGGWEFDWGWVFVAVALALSIIASIIAMSVALA